MIISVIKDGLGNQLFMYACGYAAARKAHGKFILDATYLATSNLRRYELGMLKIRYDGLINISVSFPYVLKVAIRKLVHGLIKLVTKPYNEKITYEFDASVLALKSSYCLCGYWQSEKYFKEYRDEILPMLTPNYSTTKSFNSTLAKIQNTQSISVHVRRGVFIALGFCLDEKYYKNSIELMLKKVSKPIFYFFSDDIEYAKKHCLFEGLDVEIEFVSYEAINPIVEDFLLMKSCKHNIIANSSYSWWSAWANNNPEKIVLCPKREARDFFYPAEWIVVS